MKTIPLDRLVRCRIRTAFTAVFLVASVGCTTLTSYFSPEGRIDRYIERHPERPQDIRQALQNEMLCKGMTPEEVKLCWGSPNERKETREDGAYEEVWSYFEKHNNDASSGDGSYLFAYTVPLGRAVFTKTGKDLVLSEWMLYGSEQGAASEMSGRGQHRAGSADGRVPPARGAESSSLNPPKITPSADLSRWPALRVTGILRSGQQQVALINNTTVSPGDTIHGATVVAISPTGVYLQYGAETIVLTKGRETHPPSSLPPEISP